MRGRFWGVQCRRRAGKWVLMLSHCGQRIQEGSNGQHVPDWLETGSDVCSNDRICVEEEETRYVAVGDTLSVQGGSCGWDMMSTLELAVCYIEQR